MAELEEGAERLAHAIGDDEIVISDPVATYSIAELEEMAQRHKQYVHGDDDEPITRAAFNAQRKLDRATVAEAVGLVVAETELRFNAALEQLRREMLAPPAEVGFSRKARHR